jgi:hypothetical protein
MFGRINKSKVLTRLRSRRCCMTFYEGNFSTTRDFVLARNRYYLTRTSSCFRHLITSKKDLPQKRKGSNLGCAAGNILNKN